jgi:hypothetical protein
MFRCASHETPDSRRCENEMKKTIAIFTLAFVIATSARGLSIDFGEYTRLTPTNAASHRFTFHYHAPVPALITVTMPYQQGKASFDHAELEVSADDQHFKLPVAGKKKEKDELFIAFWMDRRTLRQATLRITFVEEGNIIEKVFWLQCKDFVPERGESHNNSVEDIGANRAESSR